MKSRENPETGGPSSLDPSPDQIRAMGQAAIEAVADYYSALPDLPIQPETTSQELREQLSRDVPVEGTDFETLLQQVREVIFAASRHNGHPRFFGYVASPG